MLEQETQCYADAVAPAGRRGLDDLWSTPSEGSQNTEPRTFTSLEGQRITWQGDDGDEELHCNPLFETPRGLQSQSLADSPI